jgi:hypothetical protein
MKFIILIVSFVFLCYGLLSSGVAQVAVEYGLIGSNTGSAVSSGLGRTSCLSNACRNKQASKSATVKKGQEPRVVEKRQKGRGLGTGPLIIERRGDHYERIR